MVVPSYFSFACEMIKQIQCKVRFHMLPQVTAVIFSLAAARIFYCFIIDMLGSKRCPLEILTLTTNYLSYHLCSRSTPLWIFCLVLLFIGEKLCGYSLNRRILCNTSFSLVILDEVA
ncbi:hypothetical protein SEVIR_8G150750v4 [Setaria viridis]|uniref:Uncharacterized protein n=1 Tax=Setaria viridis TaxID=4556 RepID=A0A4U6TTP8_SETVI|nr:hypothetical protein SEVIR_8G150750v2 [Setaria viridis]TKW01038.1 hypothetical protein SEVIR_8G150750v2 [Setaria viridis]